MTSSLVGSEMCIRDRIETNGGEELCASPGGAGTRSCCRAASMAGTSPVSYTHLTLPTICSV
eukprot:8571448-Prorocentrum_lima.AAC.1